jgi:hypothetical protein
MAPDRQGNPPRESGCAYTNVAPRSFTLKISAGIKAIWISAEITYDSHSPMNPPNEDRRFKTGLR